MSVVVEYSYVWGQDEIISRAATAYMDDIYKYINETLVDAVFFNCCAFSGVRPGGEEA